MIINQDFQNRIRRVVQILQTFADRIWYPPFIGVLAALDNFVMIILDSRFCYSDDSLNAAAYHYYGKPGREATFFISYHHVFRKNN
jgi:hypothetical protein